MSKRSRSRSKPASGWRQHPLVQHPLFIPGIIAALGLLFFAFGGRLVNSGSSTSGGVPALVGTKQYSAAPPMTIDPSKTYIATIRTVKGDIVIQLLPDKAPVTVNNFVFLARQGYYDGVTFHRVLPGFMAQGGDPTGTGAGGPGYRFQDEISDLKFDSPGVVAMANSGPNTNGSQFFITYAPEDRLNGGYTIFGRVIQGQDVAESLTPRDPSQNPTFQGDVIETITIEEK